MAARHRKSDGSLRDADFGAAQTPRGLADSGSASIKRIQYQAIIEPTKKKPPGEGGFEGVIREASGRVDEEVALVIQNSGCLFMT